MKVCWAPGGRLCLIWQVWQLGLRFLAQLLERAVSNSTSILRALEENLHAGTLNPTSCEVEVLDLKQ